MAASVVMGAMAYRSARSTQATITAELAAGQRELDVAKQLLKDGNQKADVGLIDQAVTHAHYARRNFAAAEADYGRNILLSSATPLPGINHYLGPRTKAVLGLSRMGVSICDAVDAAAQLDKLFLARDTTQQTAGAHLLAVLQAAEPLLATIDRKLGDALKAQQSVDRSVLPTSSQASFTHASQTISSAAAGIHNFRQLSPALLEILGSNGPRTYLIEQLNPAELRPGGGYIGSYSLLRAEAGALTITKSAGIETVDFPRAVRGQPNYVEPPKTTVEFFGDKSWVLGDSNLFPDFPSNAKAAETLAARQLGVTPDGVIAMDPTAVADLLAVTGPLRIPEYGVTVDSESFVNELFQRESNASVDYRTKKLFLGAVAGPLMVAVSSLGSQRWPSLIDRLSAAFSHRNMQVYFNNDVAQAQMERYGWTGGLSTAPDRDFLIEVEANFGGSKANHFIDRRYELELTHVNGKLHHKLQVSLDNATPAGLEGGNRFYRYYARLYVPRNATAMFHTGLKADEFPTSEQVPEAQLMDGWGQVNVDPRTGHGRTTFSFEYDTTWPADSAGRHLLYWQKQPGTGSDAINIRWLSPAGSVVAQSDLAEDRLVELTPTEVRVIRATQGRATIPSLSF